MKLPKLGREALYGLPGQIVLTLDPYTEADRVAVLVTFLAIFGCYVGVSPRVIGGDPHRGRLFILLVGRSAKARKGTSLSVVLRLFSALDEEWTRDRIAGGLASGEAMTATVAEGDKRLVVIEPEFDRFISVAGRSNSILSSQLRQVYDHGKLENRRARESQVVTGAHIAVLGHITADELLAKLSEVDTVNGFLNRFLMFGVARSKRLPSGGKVPPETHAELVSAIRDAVGKARRVGDVTRTPDAEQLWEVMYGVLGDDDPPPPLGPVIGRSETHVLRLALVYTVSDGCSRMDVQHLEAGYEVWRYARSTAASLFESRALDANSNRLLEALRNAGDAGMSGTDVMNLFSRNLSGDALDGLRGTLERLGLAVLQKVETGGRPLTLLRVTDKGMAGDGSGADPLPTLAELRLKAGLPARGPGEVAA